MYSKIGALILFSSWCVHSDLLQPGLLLREELPGGSPTPTHHKSGQLHTTPPPTALALILTAWAEKDLFHLMGTFYIRILISVGEKRPLSLERSFL